VRTRFKMHTTDATATQDMKDVVQSTFAKVKVGAVIGGENYPKLRRTHTDIERLKFARMNEWKVDLGEVINVEEMEGKSLVMKPLWSKKIIGMTAVGQAQEPVIEITGPRSETIDADAAKRYLDKQRWTPCLGK